MQRYEGASTTYGPHTLEAYQLIFSEMATSLAQDSEFPPGPTPPDLRGFPDYALGPLRNDTTPEGMTYGEILEDADLSYSQVKNIFEKSIKTSIH